MCASPGQLFPSECGPGDRSLLQDQRLCLRRVHRFTEARLQGDGAAHFDPMIDSVLSPSSPSTLLTLLPLSNGRRLTGQRTHRLSSLAAAVCSSHMMRNEVALTPAFGPANAPPEVPRYTAAPRHILGGLLPPPADGCLHQPTDRRLAGCSSRRAKTPAGLGRQDPTALPSPSASKLVSDLTFPSSAS